MGGDGGHDQIEALDLQRGQAEDQTGHSGGQGGTGQGRQEGPAQLGGQDGGDIGADGHETHMPHGDLPAIAGQNIEPVDTDNGNADHGHDGQKPVTEKQAGRSKER